MHGFDRLDSPIAMGGHRRFRFYNDKLVVGRIAGHYFKLINSCNTISYVCSVFCVAPRPGNLLTGPEGHLILDFEV